MRPTLPTALLTMLLLAACGGEAEPPATAAAPPDPAAEASEDAAPEAAPLPTGDFRVVAVELGTAFDEEGRVPAPKDLFKATDTLHVAVVGVGSSPGLVLSARWLAADGSEVAQARQDLAPQAPTVASFRLSQPEPWPAGDYRVEIAVNDRVAETRNFRIE